MTINVKYYLAALFLLFLYLPLFSADYNITLTDGRTLLTWYVDINKKEATLFLDDGHLKIPLFLIIDISATDEKTNVIIKNNFLYYKTEFPPFLINTDKKDKSKQLLPPSSETEKCQYMAVKLQMEKYREFCIQQTLETNNAAVEKALLFFKSG